LEHPHDLVTEEQLRRALVDVETVHRGDARQIQREILKAGFIFAGSSPVLRHPEDDRTMNVFNQEIRRKTDRFVYRFQKPGAR
jgi:predicted methyltransferase